MKYELMQIVFSQPGVAEYLSDGTFDTERLAPGEVVVRTAVSTVSPGTESTQHLWTIRDDIDAVMRLVAGGRVDLDGLVQETYLPESAQAVYGRLAYGKDFPVCVQFDWRGLEL